MLGHYVEEILVLPNGSLNAPRVVGCLGIRSWIIDWERASDQENKTSRPSSSFWKKGSLLARAYVRRGEGPFRLFQQNPIREQIEQLSNLVG